MDRKLPIGTGRDGSPIYINLDFLDGTRGAHISISGISGVATKTSYALFLLHSSCSAPACWAPARSTPRRWCSRSRARTCCSSTTPTSGSTTNCGRSTPQVGLPAEPFASVGFYSPPTPDDPTGRPHVTGRTSGVEPFWWTLRGVLPGRTAALRVHRRRGRAQPVHDGGQPGRRPAAAGRGRAAGKDGARQHRRRPPAAPTTSWSTSSSTGSPTTPPARSGPARSPGSAPSTPSSAGCGRRCTPLRDLIRADLPDTGARQISTGNQQVTVVDLHNLRERAQRFVVGVVLAAETARKEAAGPGSLLFTMIDELNKYAPREGNSPIKDVLLDIAERGRSLGIILIGAQQTASEVERRIVSNSSIKVVGRLDAAEAGRPEYGFLPPSQRTRATLAKPGTMFVSPSRRSRCRWPSSSRSRPGRPGRPNAAPRRRRRPTDRRPRRSAAAAGRRRRTALLTPVLIRGRGPTT